MPIEFHWDDYARTTLRMDVYPNATWEEFHRVIDKVLQEAQSASSPVDLIVHVGQTPTGNPIRSLKSGVSSIEVRPNIGRVATASNEPAVSAIHSIIMRILGGYGIASAWNGSYFEELKDARAALAHASEAEELLPEPFA